MQRLITLLSTCIIALCALTSCNLNKDYHFTYTNEATIQIKDKEDAKAVEKYLKTNYVEAKDNLTYFGKYDDAIRKYIDHFVEVQATVDEDFLRNHLKEDTDYVTLIGYMNYEDGKSWVGYRTWAKVDPTPEVPTDK